MNRISLVFLILIGLLVVNTAQADNALQQEIARGKLLVANEALQDPNFDSAVVLIVGHGNLGTLGLIINRPFEDPNQIELPADLVSLFKDSPRHFGGPVPSNGLIALVASDYTVPNAIHVHGNIYFLDNPQAFEYLLNELESPQPTRIYKGISSWIPGQLAAEIRAGAWYVLDPQPALVFGDSTKMWEALLTKIHAKWVKSPVLEQKNLSHFSADSIILSYNKPLTIRFRYPNRSTFREND
ncbi:MAG: YqgE/AlgH family protein [Pseudomonadota bacterium]